MFEIRAAQPGDLELLHSIDPLAAPGSDRHADIGHWMKQGACHVALRNGAIAGYLAITEFLHQPFIELVVVAEPHRRRGVASALIHHALGLTPGAKVWTSTNRSNTPMRALLSKLGFDFSGRVDNLDPGDPELFFVHQRGSRPTG